MAARRVRTTTPDGSRRSDVWPLTEHTSGFVFDRHGVATLRYSDMMRSLGMPFDTRLRAKAVRMANDIVTDMKLRRDGLAPTARPETRTIGAAFAEYDAGPLASRPREARLRARRMLVRMVPEDRPLTDSDVYDATATGVPRLGIDLGTVVIGTPVRLPALHPRTQRQYIGDWRAFVRWCVGRGWLTRDVTEMVAVPRLPQSRRARVYSDTDLERIGTYCAGRSRSPGDSWDAFALLVRWLAVTGMRITETLSLEWRDVSSDRVRLRAETTKTKRERVFPLRPFPEAALVLGELAAHGIGRHGRLWPWTQRKRPEQMMRWAVTALEIADVRLLHGLRATASARWRREGIAPDTRARLAGHSVAVMLGHYDADADARELTEAVDRARNMLGMRGGIRPDLTSEGGEIGPFEGPDG